MTWTLGQAVGSIYGRDRWLLIKGVVVEVAEDGMATVQFTGWSGHRVERTFRADGLEIAPRSPRITRRCFAWTDEHDRRLQQQQSAFEEFQACSEDEDWP